MKNQPNDGSVKLVPPVGESPPGAPGLPPYGEQAACPKKPTILFVEDEVRQLELMRKVLEGDGFKVLTAVSGTEAVDAHLQHREEIAVIVLDLGLPGMSGWDAVQKMREVEPNLKFVLATGYLSPEIESAVAADPLSRLVLKPYRLDEIVPLISSMATT